MMEPLYILLEIVFWLLIGMLGVALALIIGVTIALIVCGTRAYKEQKRTLREAEEDLDEFEDMVCNLPIAKEYMDSDFVISCAEKLDENDIEGFIADEFPFIPMDVQF